MGMQALCVVIIFLCTNFALAQSFYTACTPLPSSPTAAAIDAYNTCIANNRASAQSSGTAAAQSFTLNGSTVVAPSGGSSEQNDIYNKNVNINTTTAAAPITAEQQAAVSVTATSARAVLGESVRANTEGETNYLVTSEGALAEGLGKLSVAGECASVSTSACYNQRTELYATGAAYLLAQRQAQDQAGQHQSARSIACVARNQISSVQEPCDNALDSALSSMTGSVMASMSGITVTVNPGVSATPLSPITYDPLTGACSPANSPACVNLTRTVTPLSLQMQQTVREILKQKYSGNKHSTIAGQSLYSTNPDGSVTVKGGGVYSLKDFSDSKNLKAKGFSDTFAQSIAKTMTAWMGSGTSSTTSAITSVVDKDIKEVSATTVISAMSTHTVSAPVVQDIDTEREPASLKIQLGEEEFIGVAKDDIFKIINRRYKNEEKDDYFY